MGPLSERDGWGEAEVAAAEERLGVRLPAGLREAYLLFGRRNDLTGNHDVLLAPADLYLDDAGEALVFREENQGAASWGVRLAGPERDDPAVLIRADLADKTAERWEPWLDRVSLAFVEMVLSESLHAPGDRGDILDAPDDGGLTRLESHCVPLPFPPYPAGEQEPGTRWFAGPDVLVRDEAGICLLARGRTPKALARFRELIPGDWLNG